MQKENLEMYKITIRIDFFNNCKSINELNDNCNGIDLSSNFLK